ncbi:hypothetical protein CTAYLR_010147 [Chrysophaeum taylorii]|uniref:Sulfatase N-terminal domain-containing protein n=1 Tax=Chrysophaeum taylorii TaxID=2483200 RepID=A0AAD7XNB8_9STRA|nr:hypothetical protein CTAYLR_010147 [Chrysophaeum taylorii]
MVVILFSLCVAGVTAQKNVVWFIVDDLRPQFVSYGQTFMQTPNVDALVSRSVVFDRAYAQFAVCAPSRNSFMTGRRPDRTQAFNFADDFREVGANWTTLPEHFKNHGYVTLGGGKTFHPNLPPNYDEPYSWSQDEPYYNFTDDTCDEAVSPVPPYDGRDDEICTVSNASALWDYRMASKGIEWMGKYVDRPFFFALGMRRPHLKSIVPVDVFESYPERDDDVPAQATFPRDIHNIAWCCNYSAKLNGTDVYSQGPWYQAYDNYTTSELRRGYYASVTWVDSQIGRVLTAVDNYGLVNDTIVVLHGDHGYQLGEKSCWRKQTNFELATRVPLLVSAPFLSGPKRVPYPVELVDLYKTLADLANITAPEPSVQGKSLAAYFDDSTPSEYGRFFSAYSQFDRCPSDTAVDVNNLTASDNVTAFHGGCSETAKQNITFMGYTLRTLDWRYTVWLYFNGTSLKGDWGDCHVADGFCPTELYRHGASEDLGDFERFEPTNLASQPGHAALKVKLHAQLQAHFQSDQ